MRKLALLQQKLGFTDEVSKDRSCIGSSHRSLAVLWTSQKFIMRTRLKFVWNLLVTAYSLGIIDMNRGSMKQKWVTFKQ